MLQSSDLTPLKQALRGELIQRDDPGYDAARRVYNGMIDKRPLLIARCRDAADVMAAVRFGREHDLLMAVRGGGHNGPGLGTCDDGLVIDLSPMRGVRVQPEERTILAGAGCTLGDVDHAGHPFGLAVPGGVVAGTGVSGLTLGGGHGYLSRKYGLTIDNLLEADVVLADGSFVTANAGSHPDLFWALRGGGGNFGVATHFVFQGQPVDMVFGGPIFWEFEHAREIMQWYREALPQLAPEHGTFLGLQAVPPTAPFPQEHWGKKACVLVVCYAGPLDQAQAALEPMRRALPKPIIDWAQPLPFPALQSMFDPLLPPGLQWYWKGDFVKELPDAAIDAHLEHAAAAPTPMCLMHLYPVDGAVHHVGPHETAWTRRDATWSMVICGVSPDPAQAGVIRTWAREYWQAVHPFGMGSAYTNFMMEEGEDRIRATFGENYDRLVAVKREYDPDNLFHVNQNIRP